MINIDNQQDFLESALLERAARLTLEISTSLNTGLHPDSPQGVDPVNSDITIVLTDNAQLHELNRDYLGVDAPTDVLSFPASETDPETGMTYLGDILISIPRATQQAQAAGHPLAAEVQLLVVHGTLHLLGYDHAEAQEKDRMWKVQDEVMSQLGLSYVRIQDTE